MKSKLYKVTFNGLWLGGKAMIKAINEEAAFSALKKEWPSAQRSKCKFTEVDYKDGILYFDSGDY